MTEQTSDGERHAQVRRSGVVCAGWVWWSRGTAAVHHWLTPVVVDRDLNAWTEWRSLMTRWRRMLFVHRRRRHHRYASITYYTRLLAVTETTAAPSVSKLRADSDVKNCAKLCRKIQPKTRTGCWLLILTESLIFPDPPFTKRYRPYSAKLYIYSCAITCTPSSIDWITLLRTSNEAALPATRAGRIELSTARVLCRASYRVLEYSAGCGSYKAAAVTQVKVTVRKAVYRRTPDS